MTERTPAQRARDDEDHRLALCGLRPDERSGEELEDFYGRHHDFQIFGGPLVCSSGLISANWPRVPAMGSSRLSIRESDTGGKTRLSGRPPNKTFASGHPQAQPPQTRSGTKGVGGPPSPRSHALGPTPLSTA